MHQIGHLLEVLPYFYFELKSIRSMHASDFFTADFQNDSSKNMSQLKVQSYKIKSLLQKCL